MVDISDVFIIEEGQARVEGFAFVPFFFFFFFTAEFSIYLC